MNTGFGTPAKEYLVTVKWKYGFEHSYNQKLTAKQLKSEKERYADYNWIETVEYKDLTE